MVGIDQSRAMLARANEKFPDQRTEKIGLQEITFDAAFDGIICMDAMEFIALEDWPAVLSNFARALKRQGHLYFTVEIIAAQQRDDAYREGLKRGLPVVEGEYAHEGSYHYYPALDQVRLWASQVSFSLIEEGEGDEYHHVLVQRA
jgi:cyclopropane fatty-acyl-phospholipid synthase-like methyltransferase